MRMKKAFIFDMDGVIINSEPLHAKAKLEALRQFGLSCDEKELVRYVGRTALDFYTEFLGQHPLPDVTAREMTDLKHELYLDILAGDASIQPIDGVKDLLARLKGAGYLIALGSSSTPKIIETVLTRFGIKAYFQVILAGSQLPKSKPDPAIYLLAAKKLQVKPEECIVLEDATSGIAAAKAAGMYCIAYRNLTSGRQDLTRADRVVEHLDEIKVEELLKLAADKN